MVVVALAMVVALWSRLDGATHYERAIDLAEGQGAELSPAQARQVRLDLRSAGRRTPGTEPEVAIAQLEAFLGRPRRAAAELREVLRREPENATAWGLLAVALAEVEPRAARRAARREARLRAGFVGRRD